MFLTKADPQSLSRDDLSLIAAFLIALAATLGALFIGEVLGQMPCTLCWYQRIAIYPVVVISSVGLLARDRRVGAYLWPFVLAGFVIAAYHNLLYYDLIPQTITPCAKGVSCTDRQLEWLGFISIPLLSLVAFVVMAGCLAWFRARLKGTLREDQ